MDPEISISIVVPMHNESPNVLPLARQVYAALGRERACELILVDDGSTDDTWEKMLEAQRADPRTRLLRHARAAGQSAAMFTGFRASLGHLIGTLDGDLQNDPADLPRMFRELEGWDMVCGVRARRRDSFVRRISSRIARGARKLALNSDFRDTGCCLRVFKRSALEHVPAFNGMHRFMPILVHGAGGRVRETDVAHHPRAAGVSKYGVWNRLGRGIADLVMIRLFLRRQLKPIEVREHRAEPLDSPGNKAQSASPSPVSRA